MSQPQSWPVVPLPRWAAFLIVCGLYVTLRGYHSRDNDQAYRLPLLLQRQDPALFADDPFVQAFQDFNPHLGYLTLLDLASRPLGLSFGIGAVYALTLGLTFLGLDRLTRAVWPGASSRVGLVAFCLVLAAGAGNIGTNHLFEGMLLDRLIALALGWLALGGAIARPERRPWAPAALLGLAALVHPSYGLQLGMLLGASWVVWALCPGWFNVRPGRVALGLASLALALLPGVALNAGQSGRLFAGMPPDEFLIWTAYVQSPQHMTPHLWRLSQWLAWGCYPVLAILALSGRGLGRRMNPEGRESLDAIAPLPWPAPGARRRFAAMFALVLVGLAGAYVAVEWVGDVRVILFQPFRSATVARGLALVALAGRIEGLWRRGDATGKVRATLLAVGLIGDWTFVVATLAELAATVGAGLLRGRETLGLAAALAWGLWFLSRHDTESGHLTLVLGLGVLSVVLLAFSRPRIGGRFRCWDGPRIGRALALAWSLPCLALVVPLTPLPRTAAGEAVSEWLIDRWRFTAIPRDDVERLAVWCRAHTPADARFIGPPGPKTFRLWSLRSLAFNRAGSPYHAEGLADWAARFRAHVGFDGPAGAFARVYLADRQGLERRYDHLDAFALAALARHQGATHVLAAAPGSGTKPAESNGPLELLRTEGKYAVYRVRSEAKLELTTETPRTQRR